MGKLAALLALALLASAAPAAAAPAEYEVLYTERVAEFHGDGTLAPGDDKTFRFVVSQPNVTRIDFVLTWTETGDRVRFSGPDTFSLTVTPPGTTSVRVPAERSDDGRLRVRAEGINPLPESGPARADEVDARLAEGTGHAGQGEWLAQVRLEDVANPEGADVDEGNAFTLDVYLHHYEGFPMRVVSLETATPLLPTGDDRTWAWASVALAALALLLGASLLLQRRRARMSRAPVTRARPDSPEGATAGRPER